MIGYTKYSLDTINQTSNINLDCGLVEWKNNTLGIETEIRSFNETIDRPKTHCYCVNFFFDNGLDASLKVAFLGTKPCEQIILDFAKNQALSLGVSIFNPLLNSLFLIILTKITVFERHKNTTDYMSSLMGKIFISMFINTVRKFKLY